MKGKFITKLEREQIPDAIIEQLNIGPVADEFPDSNDNFYPVLIVKEYDDKKNAEYVVYSA